MMNNVSRRIIHMEDLINNPDAPRLIFGLRDTGYDVKTAAADIIDNSIAADADCINVQVDLHEDGRKLVYFGDDGFGMDRTTLHKAMRYGAPERENPESLGKFGLGRKTASSSVCLKYTIISKADKEASLFKLTWDLEHVADCRKWEMIREDVTSDEADRFEELCGLTGTLVIWENCDRILSKEYEAGGTKEQAAISRLTDTLIKHLSAIIIYHFYN